MNLETLAVTITPAQWGIVKDILQRYLPDEEVWAFGSRVCDKARKFSDLDLVVVSNKPLSCALSADLSEAFSESDLPWKVDIVDWARISDRFRRIIAEKKVVIWPESDAVTFIAPAP